MWEVGDWLQTATLLNQLILGKQFTAKRDSAYMKKNKSGSTVSQTAATKALVDIRAPECWGFPLLRLLSPL